MAKVWENARRRRREIRAFAQVVERPSDHLLRDVGISRDDGRDILKRSKIFGRE